MTAPDLKTAEATVRANSEQVRAATDGLGGIQGYVTEHNNALEAGAASLEGVQGGIGGVEEALRSVLRELMAQKTAVEGTKANVATASDQMTSAAALATHAETTAGAALSGIGVATNQGSIEGTGEMYSNAAGFHHAIEGLQGLALAASDKNKVNTEVDGAANDIDTFGRELEALISKLGGIAARTGTAVTAFRDAKKPAEELNGATEGARSIGNTLHDQVSGFTIGGRSG